MTEVDRLEHGRGGEFSYRHRGDVRSLPAPLSMPAMRLRVMLQRGLDGMPKDMPDWKRKALFERWREHYDLPTSSEAERLVYMIEHWPRAIEADLYYLANRTDLGQLWRARKWRLLITLIDHLPPHSYTNAATGRDPEHAKILAEAIAAAAPGEDAGPPLEGWTREISVLADLVDAVRGNGYIAQAIAAGGAGKAGAPPEPYQRPKTELGLALERAKMKRRQTAHEQLVSRLLPHKR